MNELYIWEFLGEFVNKEGKILVCDPCHDYPGFANLVPRIKEGVWRAYKKVASPAVQEEIPVLGSRVCALRIHHEVWGDVEVGESGELPFAVVVDSGQAGFFGVSTYQDDSVVDKDFEFVETAGWDEEEYGRWYLMCAEATLSKARAGIVPYGVVGETGFGDGSYSVKYSCEAGTEEVIALEIEYIQFGTD